MLPVADSYHSSPFRRVVLRSDPILCFWLSVEGVGICAANGSGSESAALPDSDPPPSAIMQWVYRYRERAVEKAHLRELLNADLDGYSSHQQTAPLGIVQLMVYSCSLTFSVIKRTSQTY